MKAFYSPVFELPLPTGHRFPMAKYRLLHDRVATHSQAWGVELLSAPPATREQLVRVHEEAYLDRIFDGTLSDVEIRRIGFPESAELVTRSRRSTGATIEAALAAWKDRVAVNLAGGTHHAQRSQGQGYCLFNDVAVAIEEMRHRRLAKRFIVIDLDVHQGNGTAELYTSDSNVFTFSMHGKQNFPFSKTPSDLDIALPNGTGDLVYLETLQHALDRLPLREADMVFYIAGADPYQHDRLGKLSLTQTGLAVRDEMVLQTCDAYELPVAISMAGGYAQRIEEIVDIHAETIRLAATFANNGA